MKIHLTVNGVQLPVRLRFEIFNFVVARYNHGQRGRLHPTDG